VEGVAAEAGLIDTGETPLAVVAAPTRAAYSLPVTHGIRLIQNIMLRGAVTQHWANSVLAITAAATLLFSWLALRRGMTRA